ncbi:MAG: YeeE/YedE family protein [Xanthomonadales bacterium]|nr:YeeE/YedE family protein [Xanthomonadales bacterium]
MTNTTLIKIVALISGLLFGAGLTIAGMTNPQSVVGFLDFFGEWNPAMMLVMASALAVAIPAYQLRRPIPIAAESYNFPTRRNIDRDLLVGSVVFGIGWGIAGLCPGPAIAAITSGDISMFVFAVTMVGGMWLRNRLPEKIRGGDVCKS